MNLYKLASYMRDKQIAVYAKFLYISFHLHLIIPEGREFRHLPCDRTLVFSKDQQKQETGEDGFVHLKIFGEKVMNEWMKIYKNNVYLDFVLH